MPKLKHPEFLNRLDTKGNKRKLLGLGVLLVVVAAGFAAWSLIGDKFRDDRKVYAQAAGHKVYEEEIKDLLGDNSFGISDKDAATVLADKYLTEALAKESKIIVTEQEIKDRYGEDIEKQKTDFKYAYQNKVNQLYFDKLASYNKGVYKGKLIAAHFSRNIAPADFVLQDDKDANPELGSQAAIQRDKKYAEDLIKHLYNDIKSGKITFEEAAKIERDDPTVGIKAYPSLDHSGSFDTTQESIQGLIATESVVQKIRAMKPGELSSPFVVKVPNSMEGDEMVEAYFLIVKMDEVSGSGKPDTNFQQYLDQAKKRLEYSVNV